ncbi:MAG: SpoIIE family protein phosphatase [Planctomycetota bacterium]
MAMTPTPPIQRTVDEQTFDRMLSITRRLASSSDLEDVLGLIINALRDVLRADRASVFQYDATEHEFFATKAHGLSEDLRLPADRGLIGEAGKTHEIINIPDVYLDARFNQAVDKQTGYRTRCMLTVPLVDHEENLIGVAQILNKHPLDGQAIEDTIFDDFDVKLAQHLADQAAVALKRASLIEAEISKKKMEADLEIAKKIQQSALPGELPAIKNYDIAAISEAADQTGGDAFDVIDITDLPLPGNTFIFMADATGHGIGPALSVVQVLAMMRMGTRTSSNLRDIGAHANEQLSIDLPVGRFVTAFLGLLNTKTHELHYLSAGQAPLLFVKASGEATILGANSMPFGIDSDLHDDPVEPFRFEIGDRFILLSDGYYEAANSEGTMLGEQGVIEAIKQRSGASSGELMNYLRVTVNEFCEGQPRDDDQTSIIITRTS